VIIQAPMAGSQGSALAIAVCKAGGVGSLPCAMLSLEAMRAEILAIQAATDRPYNVNFFCHALENLRPPMVSFHFGLPSPELVDRIKKMGAQILSTATTVEEARWLEARGVDRIIAQGVEAGGHRGMFLTDDVTTQLGTMALLPRIIDAVRVPVIAAGGIADARGVKAARALGAAGVQVGTAYLSCIEATTSAVHRAALAAPHHTALTNIITGRPGRGIVNRVMRELGPIRADVPSSRAPRSLWRRCAQRRRSWAKVISRRCGPGRTSARTRTCRPPRSPARSRQSN